MLDQRRVLVTRAGDATTARMVDPPSLAAMLDETPNQLVEAHRFTSPDGRRMLCHVPAVDEEATELMMREIDAREYGVAPGSQRELEAFRVIRGERARCEAEAHKRRTEKR